MIFVHVDYYNIAEFGATNVVFESEDSCNVGVQIQVIKKHYVGLVPYGVCIVFYLSTLEHACILEMKGYSKYPMAFC